MARQSWLGKLISLVRAEPLPADVDPQDPLPEAKWFWRRLLTFALSAAIWFEFRRQAMRVPEEDLLELLSRLMILQGLVLVLYLVAPSANQMAELLASLKLRLRGPWRDADQQTPSAPSSPEQTPPWERH